MRQVVCCGSVSFLIFSYYIAVSWYCKSYHWLGIVLFCGCMLFTVFQSFVWRHLSRAVNNRLSDIAYWPTKIC